MKSDEDMRHIVRAAIEADGLSARAWCQVHGIHQGQLSDTLAGKLPVTANIAQAVGYKVVRGFEKVSDG